MENDRNRQEIINGFLDMALDIEDQMSKDVYGEYLRRSFWPKNLGKEVFEAIKTSLMILIRETENHQKTFSALKKKMNEN